MLDASKSVNVSSKLLGSNSEKFKLEIKEKYSEIRENYLKEREGFKNVIYIKDIDLAIKRIRSSDMIYINGRTY